jgi:hypothetical protein
MNFQKTVTIPSGTSASSPTRTRMRLTAGMVASFQITFPSGCMGLVGLRVLRGNLQLWPLVTGEWYVADDFVISLPEQFPLDAAPYDLVIEGYNTDDTYDHSVSTRVEIDRVEDPLSALVGVLRDRVPENLEEVVVSILRGGKAVEQIVAIMSDEVVPELQQIRDSQEREAAAILEKMGLADIVSM